MKRSVKPDGTHYAETYVVHKVVVLNPGERTRIGELIRDSQRQGIVILGKVIFIRLRHMRGVHVQLGREHPEEGPSTSVHTVTKTAHSQRVQALAAFRRVSSSAAFS
jgi:hypothetical protein